MAFKADTSFLKFLSMGAAGARQTMAHMRSAGFEPIELERYCTSNKIWSTKVKRLRLPDLLCVRTGLRVEVRAKSDLKIRMSDAPSNPDRRWHTGLRDTDLSAFIACSDDDGTPVPASEAVFFTIGDLKETEATAQLGPPKSASEGAERDRTWPSIVPSRSGVVLAVDTEQIRVMMDADGERGTRPQTYALRGKVPYVTAGERFTEGASILAGTPRQRARLSDYRGKIYGPLADLAAENPVDRYAAVKALPFRTDLAKGAVAAIEARLDVETEERVRLEAAGSGSALGSGKARDILEGFVWEQDRADLRMEAVFILTEIRSAGADEILKRIATDPRFTDDEIRQAAIWGLGKAGLRQYAELLPFLGEKDRDVALHAISAFGPDTPADTIDRLVLELIEGDPDRAPAASEALRIIGGVDVLARLVAAARGRNTSDGWLLATLGRLPADAVRNALAGDPLLGRLEPLLLVSGSGNWIAADTVDIDLKFLLKQNL